MPSEDVDDEDMRGDAESAYEHIPPAHKLEAMDGPHSPFGDENRYSSGGGGGGGYTGYSGYGGAPAAAPAQPRPSMDTYGAFSDPAPSGYGAPAPGVSRTMQYADPYAAVRATIAAGGHGGSGRNTPPTYDSYR
jgi:hypothetical protein